VLRNITAKVWMKCRKSEWVLSSGVKMASHVRIKYLRRFGMTDRNVDFVVG